MSSAQFTGLRWALLYYIARAWEDSCLPWDDNDPKDFKSFQTRLQASLKWHDDYKTVSILESDLMEHVDQAFNQDLGSEALEDLKGRVRRRCFSVEG